MTGGPEAGHRADADRARRRGAWRFGRLSEARCAWFLRLKGYRVLARDFRTAVGEIDLVAATRRTVVFVEVKARTGEGAPEVLTMRQRRRIVRAAEAFLAARPHLAGHDIRFDVMLVGRGLLALLPRHLQGAFRADDRG